RYHRGHLDECDDLEFATARQGGRRDPRTRQTAGVALSRSEALIDRRNVHLLGDRSPVIVRIVDAWRQRDLLMMDGLVGDLAQQVRDGTAHSGHWSWLGPRIWLGFDLLHSMPMTIV